MSSAAIIFFILAAVLIWGGQIASMIFYFKKPEVDYYPEGGAEHEQAAPLPEWHAS